MKSIPTMMKYTTATSHSVDSGQSLSKTSEWVNGGGVRSIPVQSGGKLVGIV